MNNSFLISRGNRANKVASILPTSSGHQKMASSRDKSSSSSSLLRRNSGRRIKHQVTGRTKSTGDLHRPRYNLRSKTKSSIQDEDGNWNGNAMAAFKSMGHACTPRFARASSKPTGTGSFENETWNEVVTTFSVPKRVASYKPFKHAQSRSIHMNESCNRSSDCSESLPRHTDKKVPLKPALVSDTTTRSKVNKHVQFTYTNNDISYEVTEDDIKNSWLDIDVSRTIESTKNEFHDMVVSFGPTGRFTLSDVDLCKNGKEYMVRIHQRRLIDEMLGQRANLRRSVLEEQARQKREGIVDAEELFDVASKQSKWGVEIAKSSWWLCRT